MTWRIIKTGAVWVVVRLSENAEQYWTWQAQGCSPFCFFVSAVVGGGEKVSLLDIGFNADGFPPLG